MGLDSESCRHCGVSWVGDPIRDHLRDSHGGCHWSVNVVLFLADDEDGHERPHHYHCTVCKENTPLTIWNRGYKTEFLADAFVRELERRPDNVQ